MKNSFPMTVLETPSNEACDESVQSEPSQHASETRLQDLIPIAMVIVGGCKPCAESMVNRALKQGSSWQDIDKTLRIVAGIPAQSPQFAWEFRQVAHAFLATFDL